jgi:hypothetical protein
VSAHAKEQTHQAKTRLINPERENERCVPVPFMAIGLVIVWVIAAVLASIFKMHQVKLRVYGSTNFPAISGHLRPPTDTSQPSRQTAVGRWSA